MSTPRISASSYSNTAPLIWSFLYGINHGRVEMILDNAPARSAELLARDRVDAALVPVIAYQLIDGVKLFPNVCVGAKERVRSVCLVTKGEELEDVRTVSLDVSSKTSVALTKIIFREFLGFEPEWRNAEPNIDAMLTESDAALIIGDPALSIADRGLRIAELPGSAAGAIGSSLLDPKHHRVPGHAKDQESAIRDPQSAIRVFDLAEIWKKYTNFGFVFAMWMTRNDASPIDFATARDEGLAHVDEIAANYQTEIPIGRDNLVTYLSENISYSVDDSMQRGLELYFELAQKNGLIEGNKPLEFCHPN